MIGINVWSCDSYTLSWSLATSVVDWLKQMWMTDRSVYFVVMCAVFRNIARTHAHAEIAHFPTSCTIRIWEPRGCRPSAFHVLMMQWLGNCVIPNMGMGSCLISWPVRNIGAVMQKSCIFTPPFSASIGKKAQWIYMSTLFISSNIAKTILRALILLHYP